MDKETRNLIERATQRARKLLEEDFAAQLEGDFDVQRDGAVAAKAGKHLSARQAFARERIVAAIEHKRAAGMSAADAAGDYLRDAAFTTLNRFVALKMLEARDLVQECITKGEQSAGYREFCGMAPGLPLLPDSTGYRLFIESLFDELSTEVKVLFDRRDPSSVLWPKRATFEQLLELLNATDLACVWGEDETIGWVYQFFNGQDERRKMREESQAPRNSRELAVRNQFFTPRYVVQFLTDNTLGRIWYEMRGTKTVLAERCEYMVRKPGEAFAPRPKKDPRDLRILDPACGSGHFLLYAFDLLLAIYEEAHADLGGPTSEATGKTLAEDYPSVEALKKAVPGLVFAHNLYGVDIDPRCAQIAQLALWMRAQKAYHDFGIGRGDRPQIRRSNVVIAEPLVADEQIALEFMTKLDGAEIGHVFTALVDSLSLAGDLGLLLRVEQLVKPPAKRQGELFAPPEERIQAALNQFVRDEASGMTTQRRLFVDDTAHGAALLGVTEKKFDTVLMNPPFGLSTRRAKAALQKLYPDDWTDLYAAFVVRGLELCASGGRLGAITSNLWLSIKRQETLRVRVSSKSKLELVADLGGGVLDGATVDTSLAVVSAQAAGDSQVVGYCRPEADPEGTRRFEKWQFVEISSFSTIPSRPFCFELGADRLRLWTARTERFDPNIALTFKGNATFDNFRFLRCWWEVSPKAIGADWVRYDKGGDYQPFFNPTVLLWRFRNVAAENRAFQILNYGTDAQVIQSIKHWLKPGLCYSRACMAFSPRILASGHVVNDKSIALIPKDADMTMGVLGLLVSSHIEDLLRAFGDHRNIEKGAVASLPLSPAMVSADVSKLATIGFRAVWTLEMTKETSPVFLRPANPGEREHAVVQTTNSLTAIDKEVALALFGHNCQASESKGELTARVLRGRFREDDESLRRTRISYCVGVAFGRWAQEFQQRAFLATPSLPLELPPSPPGVRGDLSSESGVRPLDDGHPQDLATAVADAWERCFGSGDHQALRDYLARAFFSDHLEDYSQSGRAAPIYWQLATPSASYSVWLYIHAFSKDTLFRVQNDYVAPKLAHEERRLESLTSELRDGSTAAQRKTLAAQEAVVDELRAFLDEVKRVAPLWKPNLDDGVIINFAPLWRLVPQNKSWQKELKSTWDALCEEKYDWAHLAMHLWPERVVPKCVKDRSLAIAHGLDDVFWVEGADGKWTARKAPTRSVDELVRERTSPAVKSALKSLLEAPTAAGKSGGRRGGGRRKSAAAAEGGDA